MSRKDRQDLAKLNPPNLGELLHIQESQLQNLRTADLMLAYVIKGIHWEVSSLEEDSPAFKAVQRVINEWMYAICYLMGGPHGIPEGYGRASQRSSCFQINQPRRRAKPGASAN